MPTGWLDSLLEWAKDPCDTDSSALSTACRTVGLTNPITAPVFVLSEGAKLALRDDRSSLEDFQRTLGTVGSGLESVIGGVASLFGGDAAPKPKPPGGFGDLILPVAVLGGAVGLFFLFT